MGGWTGTVERARLGITGGEEEEEGEGKVRRIGGRGLLHSWSWML